MAKVMLMVRFLLIPIRIAASPSSDTARIAFPILVFFTNSCKAIIITTPIAIVSSVFPFSLVPPISRLGKLKIVEIDFGEAPNNVCARFSRKRLMAIAVISALIFVPFSLTGLYATFSTVIPTAEQAIIARITAAHAGSPPATMIGIV